MNPLLNSCLENVIPVLKRLINSYYKIFNQFLYFPLLVKFFKGYFTIKCLSFLLEIINFLEPVWFQTRWFLYKSTFSCHSQDLQIIWCLSWWKSCVSGYLKSMRQSLEQRSLYKLKQNGTPGNLLETLTNFLKDR